MWRQVTRMGSESIAGRRQGRRGRFTTGKAIPDTNKQRLWRLNYSTSRGLLIQGQDETLPSTSVQSTETSNAVDRGYLSAP